MASLFDLRHTSKFMIDVQSNNSGSEMTKLISGHDVRIFRHHLQRTSHLNIKPSFLLETNFIFSNSIVYRQTPCTDFNDAFPKCPERHAFALKISSHVLGADASS